VLPWLILSGVLIVLLVVDLKLFARGREPSFREGVVWSIGWLVLSLVAALVIWPLEGATTAAEYTTVYLVERSLSLDNLFVFLMLFAYFKIPQEKRARLLFWGIVGALVLRGVAILGGIKAIEAFHPVIYVLGVLLLVLAWRIWVQDDSDVDPEKTPMVRLARKVLGSRGTPLVVCLVAIIMADIAFAIDSIPAAFGITRDGFTIWMGNVFALLGLRALFVLVEGLARRFRYLDETIAAVLAIVGIKLLIEDIVKIGPAPSLGIILAAFAIGMGLSVRADRRERDLGEEEDEPERRVEGEELHALEPVRLTLGREEQRGQDGGEERE
jgi:tellurite resistance protein TerC